MSTKELQEKMLDNMRKWQKIEDASVASTAKIINETTSPLLRLVMEIIQHDSRMHHRVQGFIADSLEKSISLNPDEMSKVWDNVEKHIEIEKRMVGYTEELLSALKGKKMLIQEYLLNYLKEDERKHDELLDTLNKVKKGMYPYS